MRTLTFLLLLVLLAPACAREQPFDPDFEPATATPEKIYCLRVAAIAAAIIAGRDKGVSQGEVVSRALASDLVSRDPQLRQDVSEIARFVYETAPETGRNRLLSFIHDTWCMGHFEGRH